MCDCPELELDKGGGGLFIIPKGSGGLSSQCQCVQHQITSSSFPVMKSDYLNSPVKGSNILDLR